MYRQSYSIGYRLAATTTPPQNAHIPRTPELATAHAANSGLPRSVPLLLIGSTCESTRHGRPDYPDRRDPRLAGVRRCGCVPLRRMTPPAGTGRDARDSVAVLRAVKVLHTIAWAFFAGCIIAIPVESWRGNDAAAAWLSAIVLVEVLVLVFNRWRCPLTAVAARYTNDRRDNFDIYLPQWLARHNKIIFGALYIAGLAFALVQWLTVNR